MIPPMNLWNRFRFELGWRVHVLACWIKPNID